MKGEKIYLTCREWCKKEVKSSRLNRINCGYSSTKLITEKRNKK